MAHDVTDFAIEVLARSRTVPVLVDFWAPWCGPCRVLGPVLERLAAEADGRWELAKLNTDEQPELSTKYGIQGIPAVKLFVNGEIADEFTGALPEPAVRRWLEAALPSPRAGEVAMALAMIEDGAFARGAQAMRDLLAAEPGRADARFALGRALLHLAPGEVAAVVAPLADDERFSDRAAALEALATLAARAEDADGFPDSPARGSLLAALSAVRAADWPAAFEGILAALARKGDPAATRAREAGRALFVLLGWEHPICERYHRSFSSALNV